MAISTTDELLRPILAFTQDGAVYSFGRLVEGLTADLPPAAAENGARSTGGSQPAFVDHLRLALASLTLAGLLDRPDKKNWRITPAGRAHLAGSAPPLTLQDLQKKSLFMENLMHTSDQDLPPALVQLKAEQAGRSQRSEPAVSPTGRRTGPKNDASKEERPPSTTAGELNQIEIARLAVLRFVENYFRHRWLYLLPLLILVIAGIVALIIDRPDYESSGIIYVQQDTLIGSVANIREDQLAWVTPAQSTADQLSELLQTDTFVRTIVSQTDLEARMGDGPLAVAETFDEVRDAFSVSPLGTNQIKIAARHESPQVALQLASAAVTSYIDWQISTDKQDSSAARNFLENIVPEYRGEYDASVEALENYLLQHPEPIRGSRPAIEEVQIDRLRSAVNIADDRYQSALDELEQIRLEEVVVEARTRQTYSIIDHPAAPLEPVDGLLDMGMNLAIFVAIGFILTLAAVAGGTLLDRSLNFPADARHAFGLPVLAVISRSSAAAAAPHRTARSTQEASQTKPAGSPQPSAGRSS